VDPKVEVCFNGQSKFTTSKKEIPCESKTPLYWREHLFFEPKQMVSEFFLIPVGIRNFIANALN
jgi:hypothetical protein